jgi:hypothetical protein
MAVSKTDSGTPNKPVSAATSADLTTFTVTAGSTLLVAVLHTSANVSATSLTWDNGGTNQAMTPIIDTLSGATIRQQMFIRINPTSGNKTLHAAWTTSSDAVLGAIAFSGTDTTGYNSADNQTANAGAANQSLTITSTTDGATLAALSDNNAPTNNQGTSVYIDNFIR